MEIVQKNQAREGRCCGGSAIFSGGVI